MRKKEERECMVGDEIAPHANGFNELEALPPENRTIDAIGDSSHAPAPTARTATGPNCFRIYIRIVTPSSNRGPLYAAVFQGEIVVARSAQPFLEACRVLQARGYRGCAELWDHERPFPRMQGTIAGAARLAVEEAGTPRFRNHRQHWRGEAETAANDGPATAIPEPNKCQN